MTCQNDCTLPQEYLEQLIRDGLDALPETIRIIVNQAMELEHQKHHGVARYECTPERQGQANGNKSKIVKTRVGEIAFDIPQVREGGVYPGALEKGLRSERVLLLNLAEM